MNITRDLEMTPNVIKFKPQSNEDLAEKFGLPLSTVNRITNREKFTSAQLRTIALYVTQKVVAEVSERDRIKSRRQHEADQINSRTSSVGPDQQSSGESRQETEGKV